MGMAQFLYTCIKSYVSDNAKPGIYTDVSVPAAVYCTAHCYCCDEVVSTARAQMGFEPRLTLSVHHLRWFVLSLERVLFCIPYATGGLASGQSN